MDRVWVLVMVAVLSGGGADVDVEQSAPRSLEASAATSVEDDPIRLTASPQLDSAGLAIGVEVRLFNSIAEAGQARIRVVSTSRHGLTRKLLDPFDISAGAETSQTIPAVDLGISTQALDYSGVLALAAKVTFADGARDDTADQILYFHPEPGGWRI